MYIKTINKKGGHKKVSKEEYIGTSKENEGKRDDVIIISKIK